MGTTLSCRIALLLLVCSVSPAFAQQPASRGGMDARWTAWLGCWQQLEDTVKDTNPLERDTRDAVVRKGVVVCVTPAGDPAGVTVTTIVETQSSLEETIVADGTSRAIDEPGCRGSQRTSWSDNGRRLFADAELSCGNATKRTISGLATIAPGPTWVDIQVVNSEGRESVRVRRYRRAARPPSGSRVTAEQHSAGATAAARQAVSFTVEEVKEAIAKVSPSTVEAALLETDAGFPLNAKRLRELDAAGVPDRILDLMIALSFPNRFVVERRTSSSSSYRGPGFSDWAWMDLGYDLFPYGYAPFGYGMWGYDYYYYGGPIYNVDPSPGPQRTGEGRVVDGLGYTRVRSREPQPGTIANDSGVGIGPSGGGSDGSSGGVSGRGYSGGGGDSGRTAVARPGR